MSGAKVVWKSETLMALLAEKHAKDVFVPECKDGPTHYAEHLRMDAWVMPKSWAHPEVTAYEIKVSRSDFLADKKWRRYLKLCNAFSFVCPHGVIDPAELPKEAGLICATKNAKRLYTKKKAPVRTVRIPEDVFRYVLMCRSKITREFWGGPQDADYWRRWLAQADEDKDLGHAVSTKIKQLVLERITRAEHDNGNLRREIKALEEVRGFCEALDITPGRWTSQQCVEEAVRRYGEHVPELLQHQAVSVALAARRMLSAVRAVRKMKEKSAP